MSQKPNAWFEVDKAGLAALLERRGRAHAVIELLSNAWDQQVSVVEVTLRQQGRGLATLVVEDDDPNGFADLAHAYTLFADTAKRGDATVRGRFNLGEKLVLSLCDAAMVSSTKGCIEFTLDGRAHLRKRREKGSQFSGLIRLSKSDIEEVDALMKRVIPPPGVVTRYNGTILSPRHPIHEFEATLDTELADEEGRVRRTARKTIVSVYEPLSGEEATIYELGIPVVETGDRWHVDIAQKVPLNAERDNVTPAFLRKLRTLVLNEMHDRISAEDTTSAWVRDAMADPNVSDEAVTQALDLRYGTRRVVYDPSDLEANKLAVSEGYTLLPPRAYSKAEWDNIRRAEAVRPAGQVTPSNSSLMASSDGKPPIPEDQWTVGMQRSANYVRELARELIGCDITVTYHSLDAGWQAAYGNRELMFNIKRLGRAFFDGITERLDELILHELGHHYGGHLDSSYHDALCRMGARLRRIPLPTRATA